MEFLISIFNSFSSRKANKSSTSGLLCGVSNIQEQRLETKLKTLMEQHEATWKQQEGELNAANRVILDNKLIQLETEIKEIEIQLGIAKGAKMKKNENVPKLLPFLSDFKKQEDELDEVIQDWNYEGLSQSAKRRPLLSLLYGDVDEDAELMERLRKYFAVQLNFDKVYNDIEQMYMYSDDLIKPIHLDSSNFYKASNLQHEIWRRLKEKVIAGYSRHDWKNRLILKLSDEENPIFIYTTLDIVKWQNTNDIENFINEFIDFWNKDWSDDEIQKDIYFNYPLVVCVFFHYDKKTQKKFLRKRKSFELQPLNFSEFSKKYSAYGTILSELASVEKSHVMAWLINYKDTICEHCDIEKVREEIEKLYSKSTHIPMKILASELKRILEMA